MSKVFEFHFNPIPLKRVARQSPVRVNIKQGGIHRIPFFIKPKNPETFFDTFCFFPETRMENKLGVLYLMGEIKNATSQTKNLLTEIAETIKQEYYQFKYETQQDCFQAALEMGDQRLSDFKKENTDVPGVLDNLSFTAVALLNDFSVSISMKGTVRIFLLTGKNVFDVGNSFERSPIRAFSNVVEGQLEAGDKIIAITEQLFDVFYKQEIFHNLIDIKKSKHIKELFRIKKPDLNQEFGCCLLILVKKGLPKIFLQSSNFPRPTLPESEVNSRQTQYSFLQKNFLKIIFSGLILITLLSLGFLIFK